MRFKHFARPLTQIFRGAPRTPTPPADPIAALDAASPERVIATAAGNGEHAVRAAAIAKLEDGETLRRLAGLCDGASPDVPVTLERLAQERVAQLVDAGTLDLSQLCAPGRMARLVTEGPASRIRQLAAQSISDPAELKGLLRQLRGKDKSVYKIIKQKCDALRAEEQRLAQIQKDIIAACESLERHSHRV
jgi:DNA repair protein SbcC/Rad50